VVLEDDVHQVVETRDFVVDGVDEGDNLAFVVEALPFLDSGGEPLQQLLMADWLIVIEGLTCFVNFCWAHCNLERGAGCTVTLIHL
jgi:hypothetical protein